MIKGRSSNGWYLDGLIVVDVSVVFVAITSRWMKRLVRVEALFDLEHN